MKILLASLNYFPEQTGIGKFQGEMAEWLATRGHQVRVIAAPPYYPTWKIAKPYSGWRYAREKIAGVDIWRAPLYVPAKPTGIKRLLHLASFALSSLPLILGQALFWRPDAIFTVAPPLFTAPAVWLAGKLSGAVTCLHVQDFEVDAAFQLGLLKKSLGLRLALAFENGLLRAFPLVSTISPRMRDRLLEKGVLASRAQLIPNWANPHGFDPAMGTGDWYTKLKRDPDDLIALYSGNMGRKQGIDTIIDAARILRDKKIRFAICGDGAVRGEMQKRAADLPNVIFLPLQDMPAFTHLMLAADIHLLPQRAQAADLVMPSKLGNILASGRSLVAGADMGTQIYDAVQGCGLAVPPDNAPAFAAAIEKLMGDPALRAAMGKASRLRAFAEWSKDSILARLEKILVNPAGSDGNETGISENKAEAA